MSKPTIVITLLLAVLALIVPFVPRKYFIAIYVFAACFIPADQRIILMGLDFTVLRILVAVGIFRILVRGEQKQIMWNNFDKLVFAWIFCGAIIYSLQWMDAKAVINRSGVLFDVIGLYWLFRQTIRSWSDIKEMAMIYAICALVMVPLVALEWNTGRNPFAFLGRVATDVRLERYRCNAAFPHSIMLGLFWATLVPLFVGFAKAGLNKSLFWAGVCAVAFIVAATASSTPALVLIIVVALTAMYGLRKYVANFAWIFLVLLIVLHLFMQAPVWHLLARINVVAGSTGWYRFYLIDQAVKHFSDWAILGIKNTGSWGWGLEDLTNQYILEATRGGLVTLALFLIMLFIAANRVWKMCIHEKQPQKRFLLWSVFVMLLGHYAAFGGVSYFGQITMLLYMVLAMVGLLIEMETVRNQVLVRMKRAWLRTRLSGARS